MKIKSIFSKTHIKKIFIIPLLALGLLLIAPNVWISDVNENTAFAQNGSGQTGQATSTDPSTDPAKAAQPTASSDSEYMKLMESIGQALIMISEFLQRIIWPVLLMIGGLLKNDILFAAGMEETMLAIWRNIRNIVNVVFILILLGIAFYNIVGGSSQDYHIKTILPKFVIALIAVNFSFLVVKVVIDGVSVVTTAIFALPSAVERELSVSKKDEENKLTESEKFVMSFCEGFYGAGKDYKPPKDGLCTEGKVALNDSGKQFFRNFDSNNAAIVLSINMGKVAEINKVVLRNPSKATKEMLINVLFSTMLYIAYSVTFVALLIILAVRLVVLWVTIVLSPLIVLKYVLPESLKSSLGGADELGKKFVQNAIAPIPIALVMSIGFIMLQSWEQARFESFTVNTLDVNLLTSGMSTLQDLIASVAMIVVIWIGVFEASKGTYAEEIVGGLKTAVQGAGKFVATAPIKHLPIVPVGKGGDKVSLGSIVGGISSIPQVLRNKETEGQNKFLEAIGFTPPERVSEQIKNQKDGAGLAAVMVNNKNEAGNKEFQKDIGAQIKNTPAIDRYMRDKLSGFKDGDYTGAQILQDLKNGKPIDGAVLGKAIEHLYGKDRTNIDKKRSELRAGSSTEQQQDKSGADTKADGKQETTQTTGALDTAKKEVDTTLNIKDSDTNKKEKAKAKTEIDESLEGLDGILRSGSRSVDSKKTSINSIMGRIDASLQTAGVKDDSTRFNAVKNIVTPLLESMSDSEKSELMGTVNSFGAKSNPPPPPPTTP